MTEVNSKVGLGMFSHILVLFPPTSYFRHSSVSESDCPINFFSTSTFVGHRFSEPLVRSLFPEETSEPPDYLVGTFLKPFGIYSTDTQKKLLSAPTRVFF